MSSTGEHEEAFSSGGALFFALVSLVIYLLFLRPSTNHQTTPPAANTNSTRTNPRRTRAAANRNNNQNQWNRHNNLPNTARSTRTTLSEAAAEVLSTCQSKPPHCQPDQTPGLGGQDILSEGLVAFASTHAHKHKDAARSARAKLLLQLSKGTTPPPMGSKVVVALKGDDPTPAAARVLYILATYYNLMVLLHVESVQQGKEASTRLREACPLLTTDILPHHRVLATSTTTGRIAVVRQLESVKLVVDWDEDVREQLGRFGYHVAVVDNWSSVRVGDVG